MYLITAINCGPCRQIKAEISRDEKLKTFVNKKVKIIDADHFSKEEYDMVVKLGIKSVPCLIVGDDVFIGENILEKMKKELDGDVLS